MVLTQNAPPVQRLREAKPVVLSADVLVTPIGELLIVCNAIAVCAIDFSDFDGRMHALLRRRYGCYEIVPADNPFNVTATIARYFRGDLDAIESICVQTAGTPYQDRVWQQLRSIAGGQTRTYGELAAQLGGTHARAVGQANALNPIAVVVPCHRVIGADASLTGYAGGLRRKRWLLDHEARSQALPFPTISFPAPR